jgi:uncharacterized protein (DUF427 family)
MAEKLVLEPSADHPITLAPNPNRVVVRYGDKTLADTRGALTLSEASYPPVLYVPLADVDQEQLVRTDHESYCPFKGDASYYSIPAAGEIGENAVWEYRNPYPAVSEIKDRVAFSAPRVEITEDP